MSEIFESIWDWLNKPDSNTQQQPQSGIFGYQPSNPIPNDAFTPQLSSAHSFTPNINSDFEILKTVGKFLNPVGPALGFAELAGVGFNDNLDWLNPASSIKKLQTKSSINDLFGLPVKKQSTSIKGNKDRLKDDAYIPPEKFKSNINKELSGLEAARARLLAARSAAVRKAGSGAGAAYNKAIAKLDQQIADLNVSKGQVDELFGGVVARTSQFFDTAIKKADFSAAGRAAQDAAFGEVKRQSGQFFFGIESKTAKALADIGASPESADIATAAMDKIEDNVYDNLDKDLISKKDLVDASARVAVSSAQYSKAKNAADLGRQQFMIQLQLDSQLEQMLQQRNELVARRNAAVSSARSAAFNSFVGQSLPVDQSSYANMITDSFLRSEFKTKGYTDAEFAAFKGSLSDLYTVNKFTNLNQAKNYVAGIAQKANLSSDEADWYARTLYAASVTYQDSVSHWNGLTTTNYESLKPGSIERYAAIAAQLGGDALAAGVVDASYIQKLAEDPDLHTVYTPITSSKSSSKTTSKKGTYS